MTEKSNIRLCGGTFLVLLFDAKGNRRVTRKNGRPGDGKNNPEIFASLLKVTIDDFEMPSSGRSFNTFTSDYKLCRKSDVPSVNITDIDNIKLFDRKVRNDYAVAINDFKSFLDVAISVSKGYTLVKRLLELIKRDTTIPDDAEFYVANDGSPIKKSNLFNMNSICLYSFVLGVWHYIVTHVLDNTVGAETLDELLEPQWESRAEREVSFGWGDSFDEVAVITESPLIKTKKTLAERFNELSRAQSAGFEPNDDGSIDVVFDDETISAVRIYNIFGDYLEKAEQAYSTLKTLFYSEKPRSFRDFYVCNSIRTSSTSEHVNNITIKDLMLYFPNNLIISGTGGIGKSMMMRHLFLDAVSNYTEYRLLPVLVSLKNFTEKDHNMYELIKRAIHNFSPQIDTENIFNIVEEKKCLILLDGLDEISSSLKAQFYNLILAHVQRNPNAFVIISSRPNTSNFIELGKFQVVEILPFSKKQSLKLVDKLDYFDAEIKAKFREDLDHYLFNSHRQFASNPLLLTIMLMTYSSYGEVPAKRHIFYAKAYETMARLHDATKGAYVRPMHTQLTPEEFSKYFSEFCARTYTDEVFEFTESSFKSYMDSVIENQASTLDFRPKMTATYYDFLLDLVENLCVMYREGEKYYFVHRSFQEYFTAVYFAETPSDSMQEVGDFFEHQKNRQYTDKTFDMLYDMIPDKMDEFVFLPMLRDLWRRCDQENGYWTFLEEIYPVIYIQSGQPGEYFENDPVSFLYHFIVNESLRRENGHLVDVEWPSTIDFCNHKEWFSIEKHKFGPDGIKRSYSELVSVDSMPSSYFDEYGDPDIEGETWEVDIADIRRHPEYLEDLIETIDDSNFPLKKEYQAMRDLTKQLENNYCHRPSKGLFRRK